MIDLFVNLVTSFAKTGKPEVPVEWPQVPKDLKKFVYLRIESPEQLTVGEGVSENIEFWDSLPLKEASNLFPEVKKDEL